MIEHQKGKHGKNVGKYHGGASRDHDEDVHEKIPAHDGVAQVVKIGFSQVEDQNHKGRNGGKCHKDDKVGDRALFL